MDERSTMGSHNIELLKTHSAAVDDDQARTPDFQITN